MSVDIKLYPEEYTVCKNIIKFCEFRGFTLDRTYKLKSNGNPVILEEPIMFFANQGDVKYQIIYLPEDSVQYKKTNFVKIADKNCKIMVIKNPAKKIKYDGQIAEYPTDAFRVNHAKIWQKKHQTSKILTNDEVAHYTHLHKMLVDSFPKIHPASIEAIWYGYSEGNVVEIISNSISGAGAACRLAHVSQSKLVDTEEVFEDANVE